MKVMNIFSIFVLILFATSFVLAAEGTQDGTGMDETFDYLGLDKPAQWDDWNRNEKFSYLENMGIYPADGQKYSGEANTDAFFTDYLGVEKPANWDSMTFDEKVAFNFETRNPSDEPTTEVINEEPQVLPENTDAPIEATTGTPVEEIETEGVLDSRGGYPGLVVIVLSIILVLVSFTRGSSKINKAGNILALYLLPIILVLLAFFYGNRDLYLEMGIWAEYLLIFLLFVKPIAMIFDLEFLKKSCMFRQELGVAMFYLFAVHAVGFWLLYSMGLGSFVRPQVVWGTVAAIALLIGAVTSNRISKHIFKSWWKKIQMLAYVALLGTLLHTSIIGENMPKFYIIFGLFVVMKILEWKDVVLFKKKD